MFMVANIKIGITGLPGAGKTFALTTVLKMLKEEDIVIGGMINEPVDDGDTVSVLLSRISSPGRPSSLLP